MSDDGELYYTGTDEFESTNCRHPGDAIAEEIERLQSCDLEAKLPEFITLYTWEATGDVCEDDDGLYDLDLVRTEQIHTRTWCEQNAPELLMYCQEANETTTRTADQGAL